MRATGIQKLPRFKNHALDYNIQQVKYTEYNIESERKKKKLFPCLTRILIY